MTTEIDNAEQSSDDGSMQRLENQSDASYFSKASKCSKFSQDSTVIQRISSVQQFEDFPISMKYALDNIEKLIELKNCNN